MEPQQADPSDNFSEVEAAIERFEEAWQSGEPLPLEKFLLDLGLTSSVLLRELVAIDLERCLKRGEPVRVEDYLQQFPVIQADVLKTKSTDPAKLGDDLKAIVAQRGASRFRS